MAIADSTENPGAVLLIPIVLRVEVAVDIGIHRVEAGILRMDVMDCPRKCANGFDRIDPLPEKMAGVKIRTDHRPADGAHLQHRLGIVNQKSGMGLKRDFHAERPGERSLLLPIRNRHLVPLPLENLQKIRRPRAGDPIRGLGTGMVSRTARECGDHGHPDLGGKLHRVLKDLVVRSGQLFVRMDRISVAGKRADLQAAGRDGFDKCLPLGLARQKLSRLAVGIAGVGAGAEFDGFAAQTRDVREGFFQGKVAEDRGEYANFHMSLNSCRRTPVCRGNSLARSLPACSPWHRPGNPGWLPETGIFSCPPLLREDDLPALPENDPGTAFVLAHNSFHADLFSLP